MKSLTFLQSENLIDKIESDGNLSRYEKNRRIDHIRKKTEKQVIVNFFRELQNSGFVEIATTESGKLPFTGRRRYKTGKYSGYDKGTNNNIIKFKTQKDLTFGTETILKISEFKTIKNSDSKYCINHWIEKQKEINLLEKIHDLELWIERDLDILTEVENYFDFTKSKGCSMKYSESFLSKSGVTREDVYRYQMMVEYGEIEKAENLKSEFVKKAEKKFSDVEKTVSRLKNSVENRKQRIKNLAEIEQKTALDFRLNELSEILELTQADALKNPKMVKAKFENLKKSAKPAIQKLEKSLQSLEKKIGEISEIDSEKIPEVIESELENIASYCD